MKNKMLTLISMITLVGPMVVNAAPTLMVSSTGQLTGAREVDVGGVLYDVTFTEGTCTQVFGTCETSSFTFHTRDEALLASQALLDQVFLDVAQGAFDSNAALTFGCDDTTLCVSLTAYAVPGSLNDVGIANVQNRSPGEPLPDRTDGDSDRSFAFDTRPNGFEVYAKWSQAGTSEVCSGPVVGMGEVMSGLQAGLTGGVHTVTGEPESFAGAVNAEDRRGFIIPEYGISSVQCDNDHILIGEYFATPFGEGRLRETPKEAKDWVNSLFGNRFAEFYIELDGNRVDHMQTGTKIGFLPWGPRAAFFNAGYIIEPYSLTPGHHTATFVLLRDPDRDGEPPFVEIRLTADFTIVESAAATP
jgi:hypothetical protein